MAVPAPAAALVATAWLALAACSAPRDALVAIPAQAPPSLAIRDVSVLDVATGEIAAGRDVLVRGDRIAAIAASGSLALPSGAETLDGRGATLLPGLVDSHGHIGIAYAPLWSNALPDPMHNLEAYLYCGVTTLLDPADSDAGAVARRDALRRGEMFGPRVYTAGRPLTAPGGHPVAMVRPCCPGGSAGTWRRASPPRWRTRAKRERPWRSSRRAASTS